MAPGTSAFCLLEGDPLLFKIAVAADMDILDLKACIHKEKAINLRSINASNLVLWKVCCCNTSPAIISPFCLTTSHIGTDNARRHAVAAHTTARPSLIFCAQTSIQRRLGYGMDMDNL